MKFFCIVIFLGLSGCVISASREGFMSSQLKRAAFDLNCPVEKVEVVELEPGAYTSVMGVKGCDRRVTYEYVQRIGWIAQTASEQK